MIRHRLEVEPDPEITTLVLCIEESVLVGDKYEVVTARSVPIDYFSNRDAAYAAKAKLYPMFTAEIVSIIFEILERHQELVDIAQEHVNAFGRSPLVGIFKS